MNLTIFINQISGSEIGHFLFFCLLRPGIGTKIILVETRNPLFGFRPETHFLGSEPEPQFLDLTRNSEPTGTHFLAQSRNPKPNGTRSFYIFMSSAPNPGTRNPRTNYSELESCFFLISVRVEVL